MSQELLQKAWGILDRIHAEGFGQYRPRKENAGVLRPQQMTAIKKILYAIYGLNKKYIVLTAPTGAGKSVIAAVVAKVTYEVSNYKTNLTTSSRALQAQYGKDLHHDEDFKVVMGTANYACSFFRNDLNGMVKTAESPCHDRDRDFTDVWKFNRPTDEISQVDVSSKEEELHGIRTIHKDQDEKVISRIEMAEADLDGLYREDLDAPATAIKKVCIECGACSFYMARGIAEEAVVAIRSTQHMMFYIMYQVKAGGGPILQQRPIHIHDECHNLENVFRDFFSADFTDRYYTNTMAKLIAEEGISGRLGVTTDFSEIKKDKKSQDWSDDDKWLLTKHIHDELGAAIEASIVPKENELRARSEQISDAESFLRQSVQGNLNIDIEGLGDAQRAVIGWYKNTYHAISDFKREKESKSEGFRYKRRFGVNVKTEREVNTRHRGKKDSVKLTVSPLSLEGMADRYFGEKHTIFMSATPQPGNIFEQMFGIEKQVAYIEIDSDFPPERSPIFFDPVDTITQERAKELGGGDAERGWDILFAKLGLKIREILDTMPDSPGIIPCVSYKMAKALTESLSDCPRVIGVSEGHLNRAAVEEFKERSAKGEPVILISAGISEGHSFNDEVSRIQILPKMPFAARDGQMIELCARWGSAYYDCKTATTLQQMAGRSMRSKEDYCITIALDGKFEALKLDRTRKFYSKHFLKCLRWGEDWRTFKFPQD